MWTIFSFFFPHIYIIHILSFSFEFLYRNRTDPAYFDRFRIWFVQFLNYDARQHQGTKNKCYVYLAVCVLLFLLKSACFFFSIFWVNILVFNAISFHETCAITDIAQVGFFLLKYRRKTWCFPWTYNQVKQATCWCRLIDFCLLLQQQKQRVTLSLLFATLSCPFYVLNIIRDHIKRNINFLAKILPINFSSRTNLIYNNIILSVHYSFFIQFKR